MLSEDGDTFVVQAGPEFKLLGKNSLNEMTLATPAIVRGSLIIPDAGQAVSHRARRSTVTPAAVGTAADPTLSAAAIVRELEPLGLASYRKVMRNHGVPEPLFGVKIEELKKFQKRIKSNYQLALDLYDTGIYDAMYLAGLIADDARMTKSDLRGWASRSSCAALSESTVAWVAAQSRHGHELAREWIESRKELVAAAGWTTLSCLTKLEDDSELDVTELKQLLRASADDDSRAAQSTSATR